VGAAEGWGDICGRSNGSDNYFSEDGGDYLVFNRDGEGRVTGLIQYDEIPGAVQAEKMVIDDALTMGRRR
jgi:hypothetical protein